MPSIRNTAAVLTVFGGALLIGLCLVSFPASSLVLRAAHGFSDQEYGSIFLPQLIAAIARALLAGAAVRHCTLRTMYLCALACFALSQACLGLSLHAGHDAALALIMVGTALFGFGFGFGGGPLNGLVCLLFPQRTGAALAALHMMAGVGLMLGPLLFTGMAALGQWQLAPLSLLGASLLLLATALCTGLPDSPPESEAQGITPARTRHFWLMIGLAVLYAFSEGMFANWGVIYLSEGKGLTPAAAGLALSAFWAGITAGRFAASLIMMCVPPSALWPAFPCLMALACFAIASVESATGAVAAFAFAGLACSGFFPILVSVASAPFPASVSFIASMLTAALMFGVGVGSYVIGVIRATLTLEIIFFGSMAFPVLALVIILGQRTVGASFASSGGRAGPVASR